MTYPQQPGNWSDPSWPNQQPGQPYGDPSQSSGAPANYPTSPGYPPAQTSPSGYPPAAYPAQAYPPQAYPAQYPGYAYPQPAGTSPATNGLAIASLICSIAGVITCGVTSLVGAILGHISRRQITERQEQGAGMALAGIITGWIVTGLWAIFWTLVVIGIVASDGTTTSSDFDDAIRLLA